MDVYLVNDHLLLKAVSFKIVHGATKCFWTHPPHIIEIC